MVMWASDALSDKQFCDGAHATIDFDGILAN
jgi:CDGSH-type Zn-finger protein